jgi:hypothetical protein
MSSNLGVIRCKSEIKTIKHLINCDAQPFIPSGWKVLPDEKQLPKRIRGNRKFNPQKISLYLSKKQNKGTISGYNLRKDLADKPVYTANVLDCLLAHQEIIPEGWRGKYIFFWGTIYRDADGRLCVRCLAWGGSQWNWDYDLLGRDFGANRPAALAS